jgi:Zn-finger nucleic acid-binding protein
MALECPRCSELVLSEIELDDVVIDRCPRCAGLWFDNSEIGEIIGRSSGLARLESIVPSSDSAQTKMPCPRCDQVQLRELISKEGDDRQYIVYRCASCMGTWLDRGELREIEDSGLVQILKDHFGKLPQ